MADLLLAIAFLIILFLGYLAVNKLNHFLGSVKIKGEDTDE